MMLYRVHLTTCALVASLLAPTWAGADDVPGEPIIIAASSTATLHGRLALSLEDAVKMGLENNLDVQVRRFAPLISEEDMGVAWGAFDPEWFANFNYEQRESFVTSGLAATADGSTINTQRTYSGDTGVRALLPVLGTTLEAKFETRRDTTNLAFSAFSPIYDSRVSIEGRQPLLKGLIWNEPWTLVKTTRVSYDASLEQFRSDVMDIVSRIQDGYWNLIATEDQVGVERKSLETAEALLDQTRTQFQVGVISKVEVVEAEAGVADRQFSLIVAQNRYENSQDELIDLILGPHLTAESKLAIQPTDRPEDFIEYEIDPGKAAQRAFARRPELVVASKDIERREIQLKFETNRRLPQLDLVASYGYAGTSGRQLAPAVGNPALDGNYGHSFDDYFSSNGPNNYTIGGAFSIPIPNTAARHRVSRSKLELRRSRTLKRRLEQDIILQVRRAVRDLRSAQEGIQAAQRGSIAADEQLRAERIRLEYGESTPFDVLLRESDFVEAESQLILAFQAYRTSVTALDRAQGTILQNSNIAVEGVRRLR